MFSELSGKVKKVRENTSNKSLAKMVARRTTTMIATVNSLAPSRSSTTAGGQSAIGSQLTQVVADLNTAIDNDPPEGNTYDIVGHVQTSTALKSTINRLDIIEAQMGQLQRGETTSSQPEQITSPVSIDNPTGLSDSPTLTTPMAAPAAAPVATDTQRVAPRRQGSIPPPKRRDSQPPGPLKDVDLISGLDPIAENAAKDDKRLVRRLVKLMEELDKTVQAAERAFDLAHNAQGGTIRLPDNSHGEAIHQAVRELLEGAGNAELKRFQETSVKMNQIITQVQQQMSLPTTCKIRLYQLDDPKFPRRVCVLPQDAKTMDELINHLVEEEFFENEEDVRIFLRKNHAHQMTPKGRLWELADGAFNLRFPGPVMEKAECEEGSLVLDWVVNDKDFAIALVYNGMEEMGSVLDLPKPNKNKNKCVREYFKTSLPKDLSGYEIDHIRDIEKPDDATVGDKFFHRNNFQPAKHNLVVKVKLRQA